MKYYKCPTCKRTKETEQDIIMVICGCCQIEMVEFPYKFEREVVIKYG